MYEFEKLPKNPYITAIDILLRLFADNKDGLTFPEALFKFSHEDKSETIKTEAEFQSMINKLTKDEYIYWTKLPSIDEKWGYKITFDGIMFNYRLGYYAQGWEQNRSWEMARDLERYNKELQKSQNEMIASQVELMAKQTDFAKEQTAIQKSVKYLTLWIAVGTIIAAIYYIMQILQYIKQLSYSHVG